MFFKGGKIQTTCKILWHLLLTEQSFNLFLKIASINNTIDMQNANMVIILNSLFTFQARSFIWPRTEPSTVLLIATQNVISLLLDYMLPGTWYRVMDTVKPFFCSHCCYFSLEWPKCFIFIKKEQQHTSRILLQGHMKFLVLYSKAVHQQLDGLTLS